MASGFARLRNASADELNRLFREATAETARRALETGAEVAGLDNRGRLVKFKLQPESYRPDVSKMFDYILGRTDGGDLARCEATIEHMGGHLQSVLDENMRLIEALKTIVANTEPDAIKHRDYDHLAKDICDCAKAALAGPFNHRY